MYSEKNLNKNSGTIKFHFAELRRRIIFCLIFFFIVFLVLYPYSSSIFNFLVQPLEFLFDNKDERRLIYTALPEAFIVHVKISLFFSAWISFPFFIYQIWLFISPGLYKQELSLFLFFIFSCPLLFFIGVLFSYFIVMPLAWSFFLSFETVFFSDNLPIELEARVSEYFSLSLQLMFIFGVSFQLPIFILLLCKVGYLNYKDLIKFRRYSFIIILIIAAFLTPPDIFSQIGLSVPLYLLYELSIVLVKRIK